MKRSLLSLWILLCGLLPASAAAPFGTAFTYQGRLLDGGAAASGYYDLKFALFDSSEFGFPVAPIVTNTAVIVVDGAFTTLLDFGSALTGAPRWLEIGARTNHASAFTTLAPRQPITPAPYAVQAGGLVGSLPDSQLSGNIPRLNSAAAFTSTVNAQGFVGSGAGLTDLNPASILGLVPDAKLSSNVARLNAAQRFTATNSFAGLVVSDGSGARASGGSVRVGSDLASSDAKMIYFGDGPYVAVGETGADDRLEVRAAKIVFTNNYVAATVVITNGTLGVGASPGDARLDVAGPVRVNNYDLYLRDGTDRAHGLGWYGNGKLFAGESIDGPVLYGFYSGGLATQNGGPRLALAWNNEGRISLDVSNVNSGDLLPGLTFGLNSGEGISSKRTAGGNQDGLDLYTDYEARISITQAGNVGIGALPGGSKLQVQGDLRLPHFDVLFGTGTDRFHGVGWFGAGKLFAGNNVNGPVLYGADGGGLGSTGSGQKLALTWDGSRQTYVQGNFHLNNHEILLQDDNNHGMGYYGAGKLYAGLNIDGPVVYGWSGGALGTFGGGTNWTLRWYANGNVDLRGTLNPGSDRNTKTDFAPVDAGEVLGKVLQLPIERWRYASEDSEIRHIGTMSQDFRAAFGLGSDDKHIATVDADGVALAAIKGLNAKLETEVRAREAEVNELRKTVEDLKKLTRQLIEANTINPR